MSKNVYRGVLYSEQTLMCWIHAQGLGLRPRLCRVGHNSTISTHFSQRLCNTPQHELGTANHSQVPGPMLMFREQKLLFSWWPGGKEGGNKEGILHERGGGGGGGGGHGQNYALSIKQCSYPVFWSLPPSCRAELSSFPEWYVRCGTASWFLDK